MFQVNTGLAGLLTVTRGRFSLHLGVRSQFRFWGHQRHFYDGVETNMIGAGPVALLAWHGDKPVEHDPYDGEFPSFDEWSTGRRYA